MEAAPDYMTPALAEWRRRTDTALLVFTIGSLPILALELIRDELAGHDRFFLDAVNVLVLVVFVVDYVVELKLAERRASFVRHEWIAALLIATQAVAVFPSLSAFGVLRAARGLRVLTVLARLFATGGLAARDGRRAIRRHAAGFAIGLAGLTWITSAVLFTIAEDVGPGHRVGSFFDGLWWSLATITTVGYGDVYPVTTAGRIVGGFTMVAGISTFAIVTAKVAEFLVRADIEDGIEADAEADIEGVTQTRPR